MMQAGGQRPPPQPNGQRPPSANGQRPARDGNQPPPPPMPAMSADEAMNRIDANRDGVISRQEQVDFAVREADTRFAQMDRDHDGKLTAKEIAGAEMHRQQMRPNNGSNGGGNGDQSKAAVKAFLTRADANQDGVVDLNEHRALARRQAEMRFKTADKNGDGKLDRSELQSRPQVPNGGTNAQ